VELTGATSVLSPASTTATAGTFGDLGGEDFLHLLVMELQQQDPLEPVGNQELLQQIASVRDIELSTTLTDSLTQLTSQQRMASASGMIGQFVTGAFDDSGSAQSGLVVAVRFTQDGSPVLQLANGGELPLAQVASIESPVRAAEALLGRTVVGVDRRNPSDNEVIEGVVTGVRSDEHGDVTLELDTGLDIRFQDVAGVVSTELT
jgi:flagellar basal-body rod modification protein FlgD